MADSGSMADTDILDLYPGENETHFLYEHLRPIWTPGGMMCHVNDCPRKDVIPSLRAFIRHWQSVHVATITLFICDHLDCLSVPIFTSRSELVRHVVRKHKLLQAEARSVVATYSTRLESNQRYVDPRDSLPPRRLPMSTEMARQTDRLRRHQQKGVIPDLEGKSVNPLHSVCRDEFVAFDKDTCQPTGKKFKRRHHQPEATVTSQASSSAPSTSGPAAARP